MTFAWNKKGSLKLFLENHALLVPHPIYAHILPIYICTQDSYFEIMLYHQPCCELSLHPFLFSREWAFLLRDPTGVPFPYKDFYCVIASCPVHAHLYAVKTSRLVFPDLLYGPGPGRTTSIKKALKALINIIYFIQLCPFFF